jgi:hypothetical protein
MRLLLSALGLSLVLGNSNPQVSSAGTGGSG